MKTLLLILTMTLFIFASPLTLHWKHEFFNTLNDMKLVDIDNDGQKEIVGMGENAIFAMKKDGTFLWKSTISQSQGKLIPIEYDGDTQPEFLVDGWLRLSVIDNDGRVLNYYDITDFGTATIPVATLGGKIVTLYHNGYDSSDDGIGFVGELPFFKNRFIPSDGLAAIDTDNNGINDILFCITNEAIVKFDENGKKLAEHNITLSKDYDTLNKIFAKNGQILVASSYGELFAFDCNLSQIWHKDLDAQITHIQRDAGYYYIAAFKKVYYQSKTTDYLFKIAMQDGAMDWNYTQDNPQYFEPIPRALALSDTNVAVTFDNRLLQFDKNGTLLLSIQPNDSRSYINALAFDDTLYFANEDISSVQQNTIHKIFTGGKVVQTIASGDVDGDGEEEIAIQTEDRLQLYSTSGKLLWVRLNGKLYGLRDFDKDQKDEIVIANDGNVTLLNNNRQIRWTRPAYYSNIFPSLRYCDYNQDGITDIVLNRLDRTTQKYIIEVIDGSDGSLIHTYGSLDFSPTLAILPLLGKEKLFYTDSGVRFVDMHGTFHTADSTNIYAQYKITIKDIDSDYRPELLHIIQNDSNITIEIYDLDHPTIGEATNRYGEQVHYLTFNKHTLSIDFSKELRSYAFVNDNGRQEFITLYPGGIALYSLADGKLLWQKELRDDNGFALNFYAISFFQDKIYLRGREITVLDMQGNTLQTITTPTFFAGSQYAIPIHFARTQQNYQLIVGSRGVFSYGALAANPLPTLSLHTGWNFVSMPIRSSYPLYKAHAQIAWRYKNGAWQIYPTTQQQNDFAKEHNLTTFKALLPTDGVWIYSAQNSVYRCKGAKNFAPYLHSGWNLVGGITIAKERLPEIYPNIKVVWVYDNGTWKAKSFIPSLSYDTLDSTIHASQAFWAYCE